MKGFHHARNADDGRHRISVTHGFGKDRHLRNDLIPEPGPGQDKSEVKQAYLRRLRDAPARARLVKLADRASNVQTLRNLGSDRQRSYFAQTVTHIVPLAGMDPWFARWYAAWQRDFADLA